MRRWHLGHVRIDGTLAGRRNETRERERRGTHLGHVWMDRIRACRRVNLWEAFEEFRREFIEDHHGSLHRDVNVHPTASFVVDSSWTGTLEAGALEAGALEAGALEVGASEAGALEVGALEAGALSAGALGTGALEAGALGAGALGAGTLEARESQPTDFLVPDLSE